MQSTGTEATLSTRVADERPQIEVAQEKLQSYGFTIYRSIYAELENISGDDDGYEDDLYQSYTAL